MNNVLFDKIKKMRKVGTHNFEFHADDVFSTSLLFLINPNLEVVRSRDVEELKKCDLLFDVCIEDTDSVPLQFDHHQTCREKRSNGITYASLGLLWRELGKVILKDKKPELNKRILDRIFEDIDKNFIQTIDALDNGISITSEAECKDDGGIIYKTMHVFNISDIIANLNPKWDSRDSEDFDSAFKNAVNLAVPILDSLIESTISKWSAYTIVQSSVDRSRDGIMFLEKKVPYEEHLCEIDRNDRVKAIIYPALNRYNVKTAPIEANSFQTKILFPEAWAGLCDKELVDITGINGAVFCHSGRFFAATKTKESAIKLAKLTIKESYEQ